MPDTSSCPPVDTLEAFAMGRSTKAEAETIESHLATCAPCVAVLKRSNKIKPGVGPDNLFPKTRAKPPDSRLTDRVFPPEAAPSSEGSLEATTDHLKLPTSPQETEIEEEQETLAPPTGPGEIGRLGNYRVLSQLGKGGMGIVFLAEDPALGRNVALKIMRPRAAESPKARQRFLAEARAVAKVKHDNIVTIYQVGEDRGVPFLAMELLEGEPLDARLDRMGRLSPEEVCQIGKETAKALVAAHAQGLVHRDIKPANLWLEKPSGRVKVLDFGLARANSLEAGVTASGVLVGTPAFMAPEQARGETVDHRADLFALGAVLYRALTGNTPFRGRDALSTLLAVTSETPPAPATLRPEIPSGLSDFIMRLLAKNPADRPASAEIVAKELGEWEKNLPIAPVQSPPPPRSRWPVAIAAAAGFFGLLAVLWGVIVIIRDKDGKTIAEIRVPDGGTLVIKPDAPPTPPPHPPTLPSLKTKDQPPTITEPPPLAEWLKGRDLVSVAKDGSGRFKTIQEALNAVRPGQVVKVLDKGTYRERLEVNGLRDVGLVSEHGATLELEGWIQPDQKVGHLITFADGFRIHGFRIHYPNDEVQNGLRIANCTDFVLENCHISCATTNPSKERLPHPVRFDSIGPQTSPVPLTVRDCRIVGCLGFISRSDAVRALVVRNHFTGRYEGPHLTIDTANADTYAVRSNVFDDEASYGDIHINSLGSSYLEIGNNLFNSRAPIRFDGDVKESRVVMRNNLLNRTYPGFLVKGSERALDHVRSEWRIDHNGYAEPVSKLALKVPLADLPKGTGDILGSIKFLSDDPAHPDYLRLPASDPRATSGAGGEWPRYMGALPPGAAPKNGDWFTAIRARWGDQRIDPRPITITEPPPLAEWLKGRDLVSVAKDGSGRFKTIQEALNAVRPGQVVKVLDKGTYRERLEVNGLRDVGLVSEHGATLELSGWVKYDVNVGHTITAADGFRLHGFRIHYPNDDGQIGLRIGNCPGFVLENCYVSCAALNPLKNRLPMAVSMEATEQHVLGATVVVRDCRIGGTLSLESRSEAIRFLIERNHFTGRFDGMHLTMGIRRGEMFVVRHNVFDDAAQHEDILVVEGGARHLEITNNLLTSLFPIGFHEKSPTSAVVRNNLHVRNYIGYLVKGAEKSLDLVKQQCRIDHNAYVEPRTITQWNVPMADFPKGTGDILGSIKFLSDDPAHPDYLRLPASDPRATGGAGGEWPRYMGALPPGPAPKNGDWFTAIRKKWGNFSSMNPTAPVKES